MPELIAFLYVAYLFVICLMLGIHWCDGILERYTWVAWTALVITALPALVWFVWMWVCGHCVFRIVNYLKKSKNVFLK